MEPEPSRHDYPDVWRHKPRGGYGYVQFIPCRQVSQHAAARVAIVVPRKDGTEAVRYVDPANVDLDARLF